MERKQRCWEDVRAGDEVLGFTLKLNATRIVTAVSGTQDFFPVHHDKDYAISVGQSDVFVNTHFLEGCFNRLLFDWMGNEGFIWKFRMEMRRMNMPGDNLTLKGKVTNKYCQDGQHYVELDVWIENNREGVSTPAKATVILPAKS